jgi:hypothetical protein
MPFNQNGDVIEWSFGSMSKFETQVVSMQVLVQDTGGTPITHDQVGAFSDEVPTGTYYGGSLITTVLEAPTDQTYLPMLRFD